MDDRVETAREQRATAERIRNLTIQKRERVGRNIHRIRADLEQRKIDTEVQATASLLAQLDRGHRDARALKAGRDHAEDVACRPPSSRGWLS